MSLEFVSTMSLEFIVNYVLDWFIQHETPVPSLLVWICRRTSQTRARPDTQRHGKYRSQTRDCLFLPGKIPAWFGKEIELRVTPQAVPPARRRRSPVTAHIQGGMWQKENHGQHQRATVPLLLQIPRMQRRSSPTSSLELSHH